MAVTSVSILKDLNALSDNALIWVDGELVEAGSVGIPVTNHDAHYGSGVFEGVRAYKGNTSTAIFRLDAHNRRLRESARIMHMPISFTDEQLGDAQRAVVRENNLLGGAYIRPLVIAGDSALGLNLKGAQPHVIVYARPWDGPLDKNAASQHGVRAVISHRRRIPPECMPLEAKIVGGYGANSSLAATEAREAGFDEAIMLDVRGKYGGKDYIAEGTGQNVFFGKGDGTLYTPRDRFILAGITRKSIMEIAMNLNMPMHTQEQDIRGDAAQLGDFDYAFFTGTAAEVKPIEEITDEQGARVAFSIEMPTMLRNIYLRIVQGEEPKYHHWLTPI